MTWEDEALKSLQRSLSPIPTELNEIDWKSDLSCKTDRLAQHLSAFANQDGGGFLVYGVCNNGSLKHLSNDDIEKTITTIGNIANNNLNVPIQIHHKVLLYQDVPLLFIYIPQHKERPICLRGSNMFQCYHRSAGTTVKMSQQKVKYLVSTSCGVPFELNPAIESISEDNVLQLLDYKTLFKLLEKPIPQTKYGILEFMSKYNLCIKKKTDLWDITNLGGLLFANDITQFSGISSKTVRVCIYSGDSNHNLIKEHSGKYGYAVGFEGLINYIISNTQMTEDRSGTIRKNTYMYPSKTIREFVANALIHQDFSVTGMSVFIEVFANRLVITNPGTPLNDLNRLIDSPPRSRNEKLAEMLFLVGLCEKRGSGIDVAIEELELKRLPPPNITKGESYTRVFIYGPKKYRDMAKAEKIRACYQHTCLLYEKQKSMTNQSLRERFGISKNNTSMISRIISDTIDANLIKPSDPEGVSKKGASYIPIYG